MRLLRSGILIITTLLSNSLNASLIDNGSYTTDTSTGLRWLDLEATNGLSFSETRQRYSGWRLATNVEVEILFNNAFPSYYDTDSLNHVAYVTSGDPLAGPLLEEAKAFVDLFGLTYRGNTIGSSVGRYIDEDGIGRVLGLSRIDILDYESANILSDEYTAIVGGTGGGVFMVATPIPAAIWLFGSGLIGLLGVSQRKKN